MSAERVRQMLLGELLPELEGLSAQLAITGLVQDSRAVRPGDAFVAIGGFGAHGLHFADAAKAAGAAAVLYEPPAPDDLPAPADAIPVPGLRARLGALADTFHGHPSAAMATVGVTGTNGKTSTVQLLAQAWTLRGQKAGTVGTLGAGIDCGVIIRHICCWLFSLNSAVPSASLPSASCTCIQRAMSCALE